MLRYSTVLWAACLCSATVLTGCTNTMDKADDRNRQAASRYYDSYYGQPPAQAKTRNGQSASGTSHTAGNQHASRHGGGMVMQTNAPRTYVVKKGDTLWGIARKFLKTPSYWPEIWDKNQKIANPHLIRPGDILHLDYVKQGGGTIHAQRGDGLPTVKLSPRIRMERKGQGEPISTLAQFLSWPRMLDDNAIKNAPYLLASRDDRLLISSKETVYIKGLKNARNGERLAIFHPDKPVKDPDSGRLLGHLVNYVGYARVDRNGSPATATVLEARDAIRKGDRLYPAKDYQQAFNAPIQMPRHKIRGRIAALFDAEYLGANCMIVVINQGKQQGIKPGYSVGVYSDGDVIEDTMRPAFGSTLRKHTHKTQLPPEKVAEAIVYNVGTNYSYALITDSSREVKNGDKIGNP